MTIHEFVGACKRLLLAVLVLLPHAVHADWFRGNTHTHTLNSDGDASPDAVVRWYREHGYQFVVITDHDYLTDVAPLQALFGAEGKFLVMRGEEISQRVADPQHAEGKRPVHLNAINASRVIMPLEGMGERTAPRGMTIAETYARHIEAIKSADGIAQINHPNFRWAVGLEDMANLPDGTLFELWSGHPFVHNLGGVDDAGRRALSTEELWDALLSRGKVLWGVGSDDSHAYHGGDDPALAKPGQAWVMVRAERLTPEAITESMSRGDFYASTGITLDDIVVHDDVLSIAIQQGRPVYNGLMTDDTRYLTRFIGKGGRVLAEVTGMRPSYEMNARDRYVRASIFDSRGRRAWTQPQFVKAGRSRDKANVSP